MFEFEGKNVKYICIWLFKWIFIIDSKKIIKRVFNFVLYCCKVWFKVVLFYFVKIFGILGCCLYEK